MKQKLTRQERNWILYDVGNSAFTLLISTIMPIYFNALAEGAGLSSVDYLAYWGYAASIATLLVAVSGPIWVPPPTVRAGESPFLPPLSGWATWVASALVWPGSGWPF